MNCCVILARSTGGNLGFCKDSRQKKSLFPAKYKSPPYIKPCGFWNFTWLYTTPPVPPFSVPVLPRSRGHRVPQTQGVPYTGSFFCLRQLKILVGALELFYFTFRTPSEVGLEKKRELKEIKKGPCWMRVAHWRVTVLFVGWMQF